VKPVYNALGHSCDTVSDAKDFANETECDTENQNKEESVEENQGLQ